MSDRHVTDCIDQVKNVPEGGSRDQLANLINPFALPAVNMEAVPSTSLSEASAVNDDWIFRRPAPPDEIKPSWKRLKPNNSTSKNSNRCKEDWEADRRHSSSTSEWRPPDRKRPRQNISVQKDRFADTNKNRVYSALMHSVIWQKTASVVPKTFETSRDVYEMYKSIKPIPPRPETETRAMFVSNDADENRDNESTNWSRMRHLNNDEERHKLAADQFKNMEPTDPTVNCSYHGFKRLGLSRRKQIEFKPFGGRHVSKELRIFDGKLEKYDGNLKKNEASGTDRRFDRKRKRDETEKIPFAVFEREMVNTLKSEKFPTLMRPHQGSDGNNSYNCNSARRCQACQKRQQLNWESYLRHYKAGMISNENFLSFYLQQRPSRSGRKSEDLRLPTKVLQIAADEEKIFSTFNQVYGPNEETFCKDCNKKHIA